MTDTIKKITGIFLAAVIAFGLITPVDISNVDAATKKPATPKITSVKKTSTNTMSRSIKVTWGKTKNAKKYELWKKEGSGKFKKIKATKSLKATITATKQSSVKVSFKVRGINGKLKGKFSKVKSITLPRAKYIMGATQKITVGNMTETVTLDPESGVNSSCTLIKGKTADGLKYEYCKSGKYENVMIGGYTSDDYVMENTVEMSSNGYLFHWSDSMGLLGGYQFDAKNTGYTIAWTLDGTRPVRGQGEEYDQVYDKSIAESMDTEQKLVLGKVPGYGDDITPIKGSLAPPKPNTVYSYRFGHLEMPKGLPESYYELEQDGGYAVARIGDKVFDSYSPCPEKPVVTWFVIYDANGKRVAEYRFKQNV